MNGEDQPSTLGDDDLAEDYDFSNSVRGKYAARYVTGSNIVVLAPDVARVFQDSQSVNEALRALMKIARQQVKTSST